MSKSKGYVDLHIHTSMSDGSYRPEECVNLALNSNLNAIAITDHNSFEGVEDAIYFGKQNNLEIIPGTEISIDFCYDFHILAYFKDMRFLNLQSWLIDLRFEDAVLNMEIAADKVRELGFNIPNSLIDTLTRNKHPGVYRVFEALVLKKHFKTPLQAERELFAFGKPGYIEGIFTTLEVFRLVKENGGKVFLAHPTLYGLDNSEIVDVVSELKAAGLDGIEVYHSLVNEENTIFLKNLAVEKNLLISGGSDFHGEIRPKARIGYGYGDTRVPYEILQKMWK